MVFAFSFLLISLLSTSAWAAEIALQGYTDTTQRLYTAVCENNQSEAIEIILKNKNTIDVNFSLNNSLMKRQLPTLLELIRLQKMDAAERALNLVKTEESKGQ